jgi:hypothetical protein
MKKSLDLSNYEIFPHKILKSRTFKKSSILIVKIFYSKLYCMFDKTVRIRNQTQIRIQEAD